MVFIMSGLEPKSLRGKKFCKDHRYIAEKASLHFKKLQKCIHKSLTILEKASISLKKSSKIVEIFIIASNFITLASISLEMSSKSLVFLIKSSY
jgi:hypothetical protein